jgi:hypothetical protein
MLLSVKNLIVQMGSGGSTGGADIADDAALFDTDAGANTPREFFEMRIRGFVLFIVADANVIAVRAIILRNFNDPVTGSVNRRAPRGCEINAFVKF